MAKKIVYGEEARKILKKGVDAVGNAVNITVGPKGRNVAYDHGFGGPKIGNDGVSIAREIVLEDPLENMGANFIKDVAQKTNDTAGDGTSTSIILTQAIVDEGLKKINVGVNAIGIKKGIDKGSKFVVEYLKSVAKPINTKEEISQVATISAESKEIGDVIANTLEELGHDAVLTVEKTDTVGITVDKVQGMEFDKGYISEYMSTDYKKMIADLKEPFILVTDHTLASIQDLFPFLDSFMKSQKRDLIIIAEDIVGEALQNFIINKVRGIANIIGVKAPGFGNRKKDYLEDIAILTGATFISSSVGLNINQITTQHLGKADRVIVKKDKTSIIGGYGNLEAIKDRIELIKSEIEKTESKHDKEKLIERMAKLSDGVAVLRVGAATEADSEYLKLKVEDSISAVKAAVEEGVVPGGGSTLIFAAQKINELINKENDYSYDEIIGFSILMKALESPLKFIAKNVGKGDGSLVVEKVSNMDFGGGYDALNDKYEKDMVKIGIIDPVKVTRSAVENAASAGGTILTTECAMAEIPKKHDTNFM